MVRIEKILDDIERHHIWGPLADRLWKSEVRCWKSATPTSRLKDANFEEKDIWIYAVDSAWLGLPGWEERVGFMGESNAPRAWAAIPWGRGQACHAGMFILHLLLFPDRAPRMAAPPLRSRPPKCAARWTRMTGPEKAVSLGLGVWGEGSACTGEQRMGLDK